MGCIDERLDESARRAALFLLASLLIHAGLLALLVSPMQAWLAARARDAAEPVTMTVELVPERAAERLEKPMRTQRQIVQTTLVEKSERAAEDAFLGERTQVVREQRKSAVTSSFRGGRQGGGAKAKKKLEFGRLGVPMDLRPMGHLGPGEIAATNDYLKDVQQGAQTLLNTKEFAFYSFYQRVRRQLEQYWEPKLHEQLEKMIERGRSLASDREHSTRLQVIMNGKGEITRILVENTSGLIELDQVAIEAFNQAGPFPNPPKGMIGADGTVRVEWEFVLRT